MIQYEDNKIMNSVIIKKYITGKWRIIQQMMLLQSVI